MLHTPLRINAAIHPADEFSCSPALGTVSEVGCRLQGVLLRVVDVPPRVCPPRPLLSTSWANINWLEAV